MVYAIEQPSPPPSKQFSPRFLCLQRSMCCAQNTWWPWVRPLFRYFKEIKDICWTSRTDTLIYVSFKKTQIMVEKKPNPLCSKSIFLKTPPFLSRVVLLSPEVLAFFVCESDLKSLSRINFIVTLSTLFFSGKKRDITTRGNVVDEKKPKQRHLGCYSPERKTKHIKMRKVYF